MKEQHVIIELLKRPIAYHALLAKAFKSPTLAIMWCQLYYWSERTEDKDGWVYKTAQQMFDETGLTRENQDTARRIATKLGVIEDKVAGTPPKIHYRVNLEKTIEVISKYKEVKEKNKEVVIKTEVFDETTKFFEEDKEVCTNIFEEFVTRLGEDKRKMLQTEMRKFFLYWSEPNKKGKMRWQLEKTFEVKRRFVTWLTRVKERTTGRSSEGSRVGTEI